MEKKIANKPLNPNSSKKITKDVPTMIFLISSIVITIALVVFALLSIFKPFAYKAFDDIKTLTENNFLAADGNESGEYYVYIYQEGSYKQELLDHNLVRYANFTRQNEKARPLYRLEFGNDFYNKLKDALGYTVDNYESNLPTLVLVKNGKISSKKNVVSDILTEFENQMK